MNRELLQQALAEVKAARELVYEKTGLVEFNKPLGLESAIEAALSRSKWVKVSDGLPVVPEGKAYVPVWQADATTGEVIDCDFGKGFGVWDKATHWMYRQDDTPQPPRSEE
jgi:hypothetical protein